MDPIVVQKYGGSSVADTNHIKKVAERVAATRASGRQVVVVVSAMGNTTDELLSMAREITPSPPRRELDMLLTCGERASMALLSMAVSELGYHAISFTGSQCGILTNDRHSGASIVEVRPIRVQDELARERVVIVAGFQGVSYKREITTLGRGGSDTTAVALAAALGAEYCEICSDVDGVMSADPRVVDSATLIDAISHDEMLELAAHGARVLHPESVEFARKSGIALYARRSHGAGDGTRVDSSHRIDRDVTDNATPASGVASRKELILISGDVDAAALCQAMAEYDIPLLQMWTSSSEVSVLASDEDVPNWDDAEHSLRGTFGDDLSIRRGWGAVSVVGSGIGDRPRHIGNALAAAKRAGIDANAVFSSHLRITLACSSDDVDELSRALHRAFLE